MPATHLVVDALLYMVAMTFTRALNSPCTRSIGLMSGSFAEESLHRPISFRLWRKGEEQEGGKRGGGRGRGGRGKVN